MKKALETVLVLAALAIGVYVLRQWRQRTVERPRPNPALRPGTDVEPGAPAPSGPASRGVTALPMIKLSSPPKATRRSAAVPPPVPAAP